MFQELKKKFLIRRTIAFIVFAAIGIGLLFMERNEIKMLISPAVDLSTLKGDEIGPMRVEATVDVVMDYYAYSGPSYSASSATEKEYIIPVGEEEYMGIILDGSNMNKADDNMEATWAIMDGDDSAYDLIEPFTVSGVIVPLEGESKEFYNDWVDSLEWTDEEKEIFLPYVIKQGFLEGDDTFKFAVITIFAVVAIILGISMFVGGVNGSYLKPVMKYCESTVNKEAAMSRIEQFYATTPEEGGLRISQEYFMSTGTGAMVFTPCQNILWVYQHIVKHSYNMIPTGKTYSLMLMTIDGNRLEVSMKNKKAAEAAMNYIGRTLPYLFFGYDEQLMKVYNQNRQAMIEAVNERRGQNPAEANPEGMNQA